MIWKPQHPLPAQRVPDLKSMERLSWIRPLVRMNCREETYFARVDHKEAGKGKCRVYCVWGLYSIFKANNHCLITPELQTPSLFPTYRPNACWGLWVSFSWLQWALDQAWCMSAIHFYTSTICLQWIKLQIITSKPFIFCISSRINFSSHLHQHQVAEIKGNGVTLVLHWCNRA